MKKIIILFLIVLNLYSLKISDLDKFENYGSSGNKFLLHLQLKFLDILSLQEKINLLNKNYPNSKINEISELNNTLKIKKKNFSNIINKNVVNEKFEKPNYRNLINEVDSNIHKIEFLKEDFESDKNNQVSGFVETETTHRRRYLKKNGIDFKNTVHLKLDLTGANLHNPNSKSITNADVEKFNSVTSEYNKRKKIFLNKINENVSYDKDLFNLYESSYKAIYLYKELLNK